MIDRLVLIIIALMMSTAPPANAQTSLRNFSFTPRPLDQTKTFTITEFSLGPRFGNYTLGDDKRSESEGLTSWELGLMRNVSERWAVGAAVFLNADEWRTQVGIKPRVRYWLGQRSSLDLAAGPILKTYGEDQLTHIGISSHLGYNANSWLGFGLGFEYVTFDGTRFAPGGELLIPVEGDRSSFSITTRIGGVPGAVCGIAVPAFVAAFIYIALNDDDSSY
jgi:hypothetical protein